MVRYLRSHSSAVLLSLLATGLICSVLRATSVRTQIVVLVALIGVAGTLLGALVDWFCHRRFYRSLERCADNLESASWAMEMIERPEDAEGEAVYDAVRAIAKCANDEVAAYRRQVASYREYVETWVHEAKTPLVAAHLILENLDEDLARGVRPQEMREKIDALTEETDRVEGFIEQALFYARSETLDRDYVVRDVPLQSIVTSAIKRNARTMISAHVAPVCRGLDLEVFADEKWVEFILGQLIQNSVKYARDDGAQLVFAATRVNAGGAEDCVKLVVRDNGCGVPAADLDRVFDRGFTGENGRSGKRSTGIGLYLVKRLCDKMGLGVVARSERGEFFEVEITFPTNRMHYFES